MKRGVFFTHRGIETVLWTPSFRIGKWRLSCQVSRSIKFIIAFTIMEWHREKRFYPNGDWSIGYNIVWRKEFEI